MDIPVQRLMNCAVWDYSNPKLMNKQYKQKTSAKSYETEIKLFANPGLIRLSTTRPHLINHKTRSKWPSKPITIRSSNMPFPSSAKRGKVYLVRYARLRLILASGFFALWMLHAFVVLSLSAERCRAINYHRHRQTSYWSRQYLCERNIIIRRQSGWLV